MATSPEDAARDDSAPTGPAERAFAQLWWSVPFAVLLVLLVVAGVIGPSEDPTGSGTSYDASSSGFRAAYLLLEGLDFPVARSKRPTGGAARMVLSPGDDAKEIPALDAWVQEGGRLVLADSSGMFARKLGLKLVLEKLDSKPGAEPAAGLGVKQVEAGDLRVGVSSDDGRVVARAGGKPLVTIHPKGLGEIWLLNRPKIFTNGLLRQTDNAVLLCRLAQAALADRAGTLEFDEFVHGLRERPGFVELLLKPPALGVTLQAILVTAVLLWHYAPRFGQLRPPRPVRRRSKEEFLDAMATLLARKGDFADAFRTARADLARRIEEELGLPPTSPPELLVTEAAKRRPVDQERLLRLLSSESLPAGTRPAAFVTLMNELETAHDELFDRRNPG